MILRTSHIDSIPIPYPISDPPPLARPITQLDLLCTIPPKHTWNFLNYCGSISITYGSHDVYLLFSFYKNLKRAQHRDSYFTTGDEIYQFVFIFVPHSFQ